MRRTFVFFALLAVLPFTLSLTFLNATASAAPPGGNIVPWFAIASGTVTSTTNLVTTSVGQTFGTPIVRGTTSGSQVAAAPPPPCGSGAGSPVTGSVTTTASNGDQLFSSVNGTACQSSTTPERFLALFTVTVTGGTGEFANATGSARQFVVVTLSATTFGSQGPFTSFQFGFIHLAD